MHAFREHGRPQPRILYWFRSPVALRVGRPAIDEDAIRLIEEHHPDLSFDWPKILESRALGLADASQPSNRRPSAEQPRQPAETPQARVGVATSDAREQPGRPEDKKQGQGRRSRRRGPPLRDAGAVSDAETPAARATEAAHPSPATAAEEAFSPEDLTRLRGRHAALLARIDRAVSDAAAAAALREAAEALNPDIWVTGEDVAEALERYESTYRQILDALGSLQRLTG